MKEVAIKDICKKDSSALKQKELLPEGKYPVFGASGIAGYLDRYHQKKEYIGIVKDGSGIGRVAFYPAESSLIGTMQYVLPKENYDIRYIGYCLQSLDLSKYKQGAAIPHIYFRDYGEQLVKVTDNWEEQHSIVSRLDSAFSHIDALKANAEKQLNEARKLFHVELTECMKPQEGWEERKLGEVCEVISGQSPEGKYYNTDGQGTPFYQGKKEFSFKYIGEPTMWTTAETKIATKGDLLMSVRAPVGDVNFATQRLCIGRGLAAIRTKEEIDKEYLFYYLVGKKSCIKGKEGVGFASINRKEIMDIGIQYPEDLSAQHSIVSHLDSLSSTIRKLEELQQKTLAECDALKQAMLREVFE